MFGKNLKYYRLKNNMSMKELGELAGVTAMAISHYEKEERRPDMKTLKALSEALNVRVTDFLAARDEKLVFCHEEFRKNSRMSARHQEFIREEVEEYFGRFYQTVKILGGEILPEYPKLHVLELSDSPDQNAAEMRRHLGLSENGPIGNLIEIIENKGILIYLCDSAGKEFSGMNGTVNGRPYVIINKKMTAERIRSTIAHEMAHFFFKWPDNISEKEEEKMATAISGAFMFPSEDVKRELGIKRSAVTNDMISVCKEYGISMYLLIARANNEGVISDNIARGFYINANKAGWKKNEPSRIKWETPGLFNQLVYRAVSEKEISVQKGAELLHEAYENVVRNCAALEV